MTIVIGWPTITLGVVLLGTLQFLLTLYVSEKFKSALQRQNNALLEKLRWDSKVREQAANVAGYMSLARDLAEHADEHEYERANTMAWELAMWLPTDVYRLLARALTQRNVDANELAVVIQVRKLLLGKEAGDLSIDDIIHHAPGIANRPR